ncbi:MAG: hypothetical protein HQK86_03260 [Nitrospinae bacterium]|nr:hypothetical protein [Nitrospinota bacterium]
MSVFTGVILSYVPYESTVTTVVGDGSVILDGGATPQSPVTVQGGGDVIVGGDSPATSPYTVDGSGTVDIGGDSPAFVPKVVDGAGEVIVDGASTTASKTITTVDGAGTVESGGVSVPSIPYEMDGAGDVTVGGDSAAGGSTRVTVDGAGSLDVEGISDHTFRRRFYARGFLRQPCPMNPSVTLRQSWRVGGFANSALTQLFSMSAGSSLAQPYSAKTRAALRQSYGFTTKAKSALVQVWEIAANNHARATLSQPYAMPAGACLAQRSAINHAVNGRLKASWGFSEPVSKALRQPYSINTRARSRATLRQGYSLEAPQTINITGNPSITFKGRLVPVLSASISRDSGSYAWTASIAVGKPGDYAQMKQDEEFTFNLYGETFNLIVDNKRKDRLSPETISMIISGISPCAKHAAPRALPVTKTWGAVMAKDAAEEALGEAIDWQIVDWMIPAGKLAVTDSSPMAVAQMIAAAAGGIIQSNPDGSLTARYKYPVSVPAWNTTAPDCALTDDLDIIGSAELYPASENINRLTIGDFGINGSLSSDKMEYEADESGHSGALRVYPSPWRSSFIVVHTGDSGVGLALIGEVARTIEKEVVEFRAGAGNTRYPVFSIVSSRWVHASLGQMSFVLDDTGLSAESQGNHSGYGLAEITYKTRSFDWRVSNNRDESTQFLMVEI